MASLKETIYLYFTISVHLKSGPIKGVAFGKMGLRLIKGGLMYNKGKINIVFK
jgi:hypothetical protein